MPRYHSSRPSGSRPQASPLRFERLEERRVLATDIQVLAAGLSGTEDVGLEINGVEVQEWTDVGGDFAGRQFQTLSYTHPSDVTADDVVVRFKSGADTGSDLRIDGVRIDGVKFEAESSRTWSTGGYDVGLGAITPDYGSGSQGDEVLYGRNGAFYFSTSAGSTVELLMAGDTSAESVRLEIGGAAVQTWANIGGDYDTRQFVTYTHQHPSKVTPEEVKVFLENGATLPGVGDRNVRVDALVIDGRRYESEADTTFGTGTWQAGSITPGFKESELIHATGYFQYSRFATAGTQLMVWAAGNTGEETIELRADGTTVGVFENLGGRYDLREYEAYGAVHPRDLTLDEIEVAFVNDSNTPAGDRNVRVDRVELDGVRHQTEALTTYSTGTWRLETGVAPGFVQRENLHATGVFQYGQDPAEAGELALESSQYTVSEDGGFVDVVFTRTATRGAVTLDYTTIDGTAVAGVDYTAQSGTLVFADGEATATARIAIADDGASDGNKAFNVAADRVTGGASLGQPRTATVTIVDDEAPSVGDGIGLLGQYYSGQNFETLVLERTDPTVDFDWGTGSPGGGVPSNNFSVRWTGEVQPLYSETYTFEARADDGVRLWVNDVQLIDAWVDQSPTTYTGTIALQAGVLYDIRYEYYENGGGAVAELRWESASQSREIVPADQLYSELVIPDDGQFVAQPLITSGLQQPTAIDFADIGGADYMYIAQKDGRVRLAIDSVLQSGTVVDYRNPVNNVRDRGLLGMVVHPNLQQNPYLYLLYTYDPPEAASGSGLAARDNFGNRGSRLTRLTLDASDNYRSVVPGSDVVLLGTNSTWDNISDPAKDSTNDFDLPPSGLDQNGDWVPDILITDSQSHTIGGLDFGPDGSLYVSNGDGTSYGRVDPRTVRVQDLESLSGKVLRIDPLSGDGYSDNPFFTGDVTDDQSKVVNFGLRNPFRIAVDQSSGIPYVGDVGWTKWEEINGGVGENFGWPYYEGGAGNGSQGGAGVNLQTGGYRDLPEAQAFYASNPDAAPPVWSRSHAAGGVAIVLGDFYTGDAYPTKYDDALFFTDYGDGVIRAVTLDAQGALEQEHFVMGDPGGAVVEMSMGPDGHMYYVDITGRIGRFEYDSGASAALALATAPADEPAIDEAAAAWLGFIEPSVLESDAATLAEATPTATVDQAFELLLVRRDAHDEADAETTPSRRAQRGGDAAPDAERGFARLLPALRRRFG